MNMGIKFNLSWIFAIAAAIVLAAMGFLSFYYLYAGKLLLSIVVAVCLLVLPVVVELSLVSAKECSKPFYFHKEAVKEVLMLIVMLVLFAVSMLAINHFFTVNGRVGKIAETVADQRNQLDDMKKSYVSYVDGRERNYRAYLQEVLDNKDYDKVTYNNVFPNGSNDIGLMVREMHNKISIEGIADTVTVVYDVEKITWWELPSVMNNVDIITNALDNNYKELVQRDRNFNKDDIAQEDYWSYSYTSITDMMSLFTSTKGLISSFWTVLVVVLAYFFILLPYISSERDSRSDGLFEELRKNGDSEDSDSSYNDRIGRL